MSGVHGNVLAHPATASSAQQRFQAAFERQRIKALALRRSTAAERIVKLQRLREALRAYRTEIHAALHADLHRPSVEVDLTEIMLSVQSINHTIGHLKSWMRPRRVPGTLAMIGTFSFVRSEPKGVCLVIAPWNFPLNLLMIPLVSAIAAGNTAIVKPSEFTPATSALVLKIIASLFEPDEVTGFEGDASVSQALLELPFDHIFFTGSSAVGKVVMAAAAKHLTSVTLELGGKSPVIVDVSADVRHTAKSLAFGKHQNAGQACIAPDHIYVHQSVAESFIKEYGAAMRSYLGEESQQQNSPDMSRIVSERHAQRLKKLLDDALEKGAKVAIGGKTDTASRYIQPTLLTDVPDSANIMQEEIFGPLLPVLPYTDMAEPIRRINAAPKPLALYIYAREQRLIDRIVQNTSAGTTGINTCVIQYGQHNLPFGGVNNSGIGRAHGAEGFREFSNQRSVIRNRFSPLLLFAPPYTGWVKKLAAFAARWM